jgi:hypothetical protein
MWRAAPATADLPFDLRLYGVAVEQSNVDSFLCHELDLEILRARHPGPDCRPPAI